MDAGLETVLAEQRLSDAVYEIFTTELGATMEQAEVAAGNRQLLKQFKTSAGGAVLMFQGKPIMRHDHGAPIKAYLQATRLDFLLPPETPDRVKALEIPPDVLAAARAGNLTQKARLFQVVHGSKPKAEEAASLATVQALIAGETLDKPGLDADPIADDRARRAARTAEVDHANNPWSQQAWNLTSQGRKIQEIGLKAAAGISASVGSHIGETETQARARWRANK